MQVFSRLEFLGREERWRAGGNCQGWRGGLESAGRKDTASFESQMLKGDAEQGEAVPAESGPRSSAEREGVEGLNSPRVEEPPRGLIYVKQHLPVPSQISDVLGSSQLISWRPEQRHGCGEM